MFLLSCFFTTSYPLLISTLLAKYPGVRWKFLIDADFTKSSGLSLGFAEIAPGGDLILHYHSPAEIYVITEGKGMLNKSGEIEEIKKGDVVVAWDSMGEQINSKKFSNFIKSFKKINQNICFVIGGSFGLSLDIKNSADKVFSASLLTFPHRLFRLILVEQIYRAHTIISNMPYHK